MRRTVLLAACVLAAAPVLAAESGNLFGTPGGESDAMPTRFIRFDGFDGGAGLMRGNLGSTLFSIRLAKVSAVLGRIRVGAAFADVYLEKGNVLEWGITMALPVHVGFTLYAEPKRTAFFYGANPDAYVEVSCAPWGTSLGADNGARVALCGDADYYGLGLRLEAGWVASFSEHESAFYAGFQIRLLTFGIGF
jgi:hypothetical protein